MVLKAAPVLATSDAGGALGSDNTDVDMSPVEADDKGAAKVYAAARLKCWNPLLSWLARKLDLLPLDKGATL